MDTPERKTEDGAPRRRVNSSIVAAGVAFGITLAGLGVAAAQTDTATDSTTTAPVAASDTTTAEATTHPDATTDTTTAPSTSDSTTATTAAPADTDTDAAADAGRPARTSETALTGDVAEKVKAAALAAVPGGTIIRVETDSDGSPYEAHVRKADGTEVVVKVDANFAFTATGAGHGPGGPGGHRGGPDRDGDDNGSATPTN